MKQELLPGSGAYTAESKKWLATLHELKTENIRLKDQLSLTISGPVSPEFIDLAERFQQHFVEKDQVIDLLRHEINTLIPRLAAPAQAGDALLQQCRILERDMERLLHEFQQMQRAFAALHPADGRA